MHVLKYLLFCFGAPIIASFYDRYEEIASTSEYEDRKWDVTKATEDETVLTETCLRSANETFAPLPRYCTCMSFA